MTIHWLQVPSAEEQKILEEIMSDLDRYLGELGEEMRGISEYWGVDLGIVVGLNFAYELRRVRRACFICDTHQLWCILIDHN